MGRRKSGFWWILTRAVLAPRKAQRWSTYVIGAVLLVSTLAASATLYGGPAVQSSRDSAAIEGSAKLSELADRAARADRLWARVERNYETQVEPLERVLLRYRNDPQLAQRIALALVREARRVGLEPRVLLAVMLVENPWLDPDARSFVGAVGLMQVMPLHRGGWPACPSGDLDSIEVNICYGASIFAHYYRSERGDLEAALLRYNGCVNGTNTPNCHRYPYHVYARAGRASLLAWLEPRPARESTP